MTTTAPILTGPPPAYPCPGVLSGLGSGIPPVKWCIKMLLWAGWVYEGSRSLPASPKGHAVRMYTVRDCNGYAINLTTYGLRQQALRLWLHYQHLHENPNFPVDNPTENEYNA